MIGGRPLINLVRAEVEFLLSTRSLQDALRRTPMAHAADTIFSPVMSNRPTNAVVTN